MTEIAGGRPRHSLRAPALRVLGIAAAILWFAVVLPGHTRGRVAVAGEEERPTPKESDPARHCALCLLGVKLEPPATPPAAPAALSPAARLELGLPTGDATEGIGSNSAPTTRSRSPPS